MKVSNKDITFNKNEDQLKLMISKLNKELNLIYLGGGKEKIKKQHSKGKLSVRERISLLLDKNTLQAGSVLKEQLIHLPLQSYNLYTKQHCSQVRISNFYIDCPHQDL